MNFAANISADNVLRCVGIILDGDGTAERLADADGDGLADRAFGAGSAWVDTDGDGRWDLRLGDTDGDGRADTVGSPQM